VEIDAAVGRQIRGGLVRVLDLKSRHMLANTVVIHDDDQLEDRIDEALEYWRQYHPDGIEKVYTKFNISASEIKLTTSVAANFAIFLFPFSLSYA
jgi:uncharacterized protein YlxP (DUF503 family)